MSADETLFASSRSLQWEDERVRELGGCLAEFMRTAQDGERLPRRREPTNRLLARLVCPLVDNGPKLRLPWWAYALLPVEAEELNVRLPGAAPELQRKRLLRGVVTEAFHRHASRGYEAFLRLQPEDRYKWLIFPHILRVELALFVGSGEDRALLVEYTPPVGSGQPGVFSLPGEFVEADRKVSEHAYRVLEGSGVWDGTTPDSLLWSPPSSQGITTLRIDRRVEDEGVLPPRTLQQRGVFLLPRSQWKDFFNRFKRLMRPLLKRVDPQNLTANVEVADGLREAIRSAPRD